MWLITGVVIIVVGLYSFAIIYGIEQYMTSQDNNFSSVDMKIYNWNLLWISGLLGGLIIGTIRYLVNPLISPYDMKHPDILLDHINIGKSLSTLLVCWVSLLSGASISFELPLVISGAAIVNLILEIFLKFFNYGELGLDYFCQLIRSVGIIGFTMTFRRIGISALIYLELFPVPNEVQFSELKPEQMIVAGLAASLVILVPSDYQMSKLIVQFESIGLLDMIRCLGLSIFSGISGGLIVLLILMIHCLVTALVNFLRKQKYNSILIGIFFGTIMGWCNALIPNVRFSGYGLLIELLGKGNISSLDWGIVHWDWDLKNIQVIHIFTLIVVKFLAWTCSIYSGMIGGSIVPLWTIGILFGWFFSTVMGFSSTSLESQVLFFSWMAAIQIGYMRTPLIGPILLYVLFITGIPSPMSSLLLLCAYLSGCISWILSRWLSVLVEIVRDSLDRENTPVNIEITGSDLIPGNGLLNHNSRN